MREFTVGQKVEWTSSGTRKVGEVTHVLQAGHVPADAGKPKAGGGGYARDHESYIVRGRKQIGGKPYGSAADYWPVVSLLQPIK